MRSGSPLPDLNGVYFTAGDHKGWPRFVSGEGNHLFYSIGLEMWLLHDAFEPDTKGSKGYVQAPSGRLPTGDPVEWKVWSNGKHMAMGLTVTLLTQTEAVKEQTERLRLNRHQQQVKIEAEKAAAGDKVLHVDV